MIALFRSVHTAFAALRPQGVPFTPTRLRAVELLPAWLLVSACQWALCTSYAELTVAGHAAVAREEMAVLAAQLHAMVERSAGIAAQASSPGHGRP